MTAEEVAKVRRELKRLRDLIEELTSLLEAGDIPMSVADRLHTIIMAD